ncbi:MAG: hypothetical protein IPM94_16365 [bacterium]|nr:hypothetical protein [bacterium]
MSWDGVADDGRQLPSGVYFGRIDTAGRSEVQKVVPEPPAGPFAVRAGNPLASLVIRDIPDISWHQAGRTRESASSTMIAGGRVFTIPEEQRPT